MAGKEVKRIGEVLPKDVEVKELVDSETLFDKDIIVYRVGERTGENGTYIIVGFKYKEDDAELTGFINGSSVVMGKLLKCKEANLFPVVGKLVKIKNYHDFV